MGSDLVERAAVLAAINADPDMSAPPLGIAHRAVVSALNDAKDRIETIPTAEPERADVATLERLVLTIEERFPEAHAARDEAADDNARRFHGGYIGGLGWALEKVVDMLTEARAQPAAPEPVDSPRRVALWDAINAVVVASGGSAGNTSVARQRACVEVENALLAFTGGQRPSGLVSSVAAPSKPLPLSLCHRCNNDGEPRELCGNLLCGRARQDEPATRVDLGNGSPEAAGGDSTILVERVLADPDTYGYVAQTLAAALRKVLGDLVRERDQCEALRREVDSLAAAAERERSVARAELAREREAHEETSDERDELAAQVRALTAEPTGSVGALAKVLSCGSGNGRACNYTKTINDAAGEWARIRQERDAARAEVEQLKAEVKDARDFQAQVARAVGATHLDGLQSRWTDDELHDVLKRLRAQLAPVKVDAEALIKTYAWEASAADMAGRDDAYIHRCGVTAVAQAFARAMLTEGAMRAFDAAYCEIVRHSKTEREIDAALLAGMRAALEHAGLHVAAEPEPRVTRSDVDRARTMTEDLADISARLDEVRGRCGLDAAEPVADESDAEVMLAAVREKMAPEHVAAFDAARAADAERTRGVLTGALEKHRRDVAAAAADLDAFQAKSADFYDYPHRSVKVAAEPVAEGRACPVDDATLEAWRHRAPEGGVNYAAAIAWCVDEIRRLGGGGR